MLHHAPRQDWHFHGPGRTYGPSEEYASFSGHVFTVNVSALSVCCSRRLDAWKLGGLHHNGVSMHPCICYTTGLGYNCVVSPKLATSVLINSIISKTNARCGTTHETLFPRSRRFGLASSKGSQQRSGNGLPPRQEIHAHIEAHCRPLSTALAASPSLLLPVLAESRRT
jgi:hypothetical protein